MRSCMVRSLQEMNSTPREIQEKEEKPGESIEKKCRLPSCPVPPLQIPRREKPRCTTRHCTVIYIHNREDLLHTHNYLHVVAQLAYSRVSRRLIHIPGDTTSLTLSLQLSVVFLCLCLSVCRLVPPTSLFSPRLPPLSPCGSLVSTDVGAACMRAFLYVLLCICRVFKTAGVQVQRSWASAFSKTRSIPGPSPRLFSVV